TAAGTRRAWHSRRRAMLLAVRGFATRGRSCCGAPFFDLCEGDDARSDEARNLRRRSECCALPKPIRLVPELVPKQIPSPTRFLATVYRFADQHLIPAGLFLVRVRLRPGLAVRDQSKLALDVRDVLRGPSRQEPTGRTRLAAEPQRRALRAFDQTGRF